MTMDFIDLYKEEVKMNLIFVEVVPVNCGFRGNRRVLEVTKPEIHPLLEIVEMPEVSVTKSMDTNDLHCVKTGAVAKVNDKYYGVDVFEDKSNTLWIKVREVTKEETMEIDWEWAKKKYHEMMATQGSAD
jgi:hypothetical protein